MDDGIDLLGSLVEFKAFDVLHTDLPAVGFVPDAFVVIPNVHSESCYFVGGCCVHQSHLKQEGRFIVRYRFIIYIVHSG